MDNENTAQIIIVNEDERFDDVAAILLGEILYTVCDDAASETMASGDIQTAGDETLQATAVAAGKKEETPAEDLIEERVRGTRVK